MRPARWPFAPGSGSSCGPVFVHGVYLINLATADETNLQRSTSSLKSALNACSQLGIQGVIFHLGSHKGRASTPSSTRSAAPAARSSTTRRPTCSSSSRTRPAPAAPSARASPTWAGSSSEVGSDRIKVCLDTQHSYAAGYDLASAEGLELAMTEFEQEVGFEQLVAVHANDSKVELGSGRDRHENIGEGHIGRDGFRRIVAHRGFNDVPFLLEVPGFDGKGPDQQNVDLLKELRDAG